MKYYCNGSRRSKNRLKYLSVGLAILLVLSIEIIVGVHYNYKSGENIEDHAHAEASDYYGYGVPDVGVQLLKHRKLTSSSSITELCEDCRLNPSGKGRIVTCLDRMIYLRDTYKLPEDVAREQVVEKESGNCAMTRFPVELWVPEGDGSRFNSMFSRRRKYGNSTIAVSDATTISSPPMMQQQGNFSIYFYETIPSDMGIDIELHMGEKYALENFTEQNFKTDLAIIDLFRTYRGRTHDPAEADLFVVPFPHASFCLSNSSAGWLNECGHAPPQTIQGGVLDNLPYYKGNEKKHLFINAQEIFHAHKLLRNLPLSLTLGPRLMDQGEGVHQIVIPYLNDQRSFQPSSIRRRTERWWTRPRLYSLAYFYGSYNKRMGGKSARIHRMYFLEEVQKNWNATPVLGGLPYVLQSIEGVNATIPFFAQMYSESVFCPVLPGDSPSQKRFFDVIMSGCIPVVLSFDTEMTSVSKKSWHMPGGYPFEDTYPWAKDSNSTYTQYEIDYPSFVVEVSGGVGNIKPMIESLMKNKTEIRRRQLSLFKYAHYFTYGMGSDDSHKHLDAFSMILESLRFYLGRITL